MMISRETREEANRIVRDHNAASAVDLVEFLAQVLQRNQDLYAENQKLKRRRAKTKRKKAAP